MIDLNRMNHVVTLVFYGRSGTLFFQSLLDGHPYIVTIPSTIATGFYGFWEQYGNFSTDEIIKKFVFTRAVLFDARDPLICSSPYNTGELHGLTDMGPDRNEILKVDYDRFIHILSEYCNRSPVPLTRKYFFQAIHAAYFQTVWGESGTDDPAPIILWHLHGPQNYSIVQQAIEDFPDIHFVQMVRNPINTLGAMIRHIADELYHSKEKLSEGIIFSINHIVSGGGFLLKHPSYASSARLIRLEDLHLQPRKTLLRFCEWLGIPWNDSLLKSTFGGKQWWNVKGAPIVSGSDEKMANGRGDYSDIFTPLDIFRLELLLEDKYREWKYPLRELNDKNHPKPSSTTKLFSTPFLMENLIPPEERLSLRKLIYILYCESLAENKRPTFEVIFPD